MILLLLELRLFLACSFLLLLLHDEILKRGRSHTVVGGGPVFGPLPARGGTPRAKMVRGGGRCLPRQVLRDLLGHDPPLSGRAGCWLHPGLAAGSPTDSPRPG